MNYFLQTTPFAPSDIYTPPASADIDIDLATLGITLDCQPLPSLSEARSCGGCQHKHHQVKNSTKKIDAVLLTDYCLQRLAEIRRINELSHTPSAFSCLMSFIGFLSSLVYENMTELDAYTRFCHDYVKELYCFKNIRRNVFSRVQPVILKTILGVR